MTSKEELLERLADIESRTEALFDSLERTEKRFGDDKVLRAYFDMLTASLDKANQIIEDD